MLKNFLFSVFAIASLFSMKSTFFDDFKKRIVQRGLWFDMIIFAIFADKLLS